MKLISWKINDFVYLNKRFLRCDKFEDNFNFLVTIYKKGADGG